MEISNLPVPLQRSMRYLWFTLTELILKNVNKGNCTVVFLTKTLLILLELTYLTISWTALLLKEIILFSNVQ